MNIRAVTRPLSTIRKVVCYTAFRNQILLKYEKTVNKGNRQPTTNYLQQNFYYSNWSFIL